MLFIIALLKKFLYLGNVNPKAGQLIPWKKMFDGTGSYRVNNWPEDEDYMPLFDKKGKVNLRAYNVRQLSELIKSLRDRKITFTYIK